MRLTIFLYPGSSPEDLRKMQSAFPESHVVLLSSTVREAKIQIDTSVHQIPHPDVVAFWEPALGTFPIKLAESFYYSLDDAWHPGPKLSGPDQPDLLCYVDPLWVYRSNPPQDQSGVINWKIDLRAAFVRGHILKKLGSLERGFSTLRGAAYEMGYRWIKRGAICRQQPQIIQGRSPNEPNFELVDRYRFLAMHFSRKWLHYVLFRRLLSIRCGFEEVIAWRKALQAAGPEIQPLLSSAHRSLENLSLPDNAQVTVVMPTYGRYSYVEILLENLRHQRIKPIQILIADGNAPEDRKPECYQQYPDLPIEVIWIEEKGICKARNACLARAKGDYVWFLDDDSEIEPDNLENHLRILEAYGAEVSVGPAFTKRRHDLHFNQKEIVCTFMDCGTTLCRRQVLENVGGFDLQFNDYLAGEDGELGVRIIRAGGVILNNPFAKRFHHLAPIGGARTSQNNIHRWKRWSLVPRPIQSIYYLGCRHFEKSAAREGLLMSWILSGWIKKEGQKQTLLSLLLNLIFEILALPVSFLRLGISIHKTRVMLKEGPKIPSVPSLVTQ